MLGESLEEYLSDTDVEVSVSSTADKRLTGNFEVTIVETGELIHSKAAGGGKCTDFAEVKAVGEKIIAFASTKKGG